MKITGSSNTGHAVPTGVTAPKTPYSRSAASSAGTSLLLAAVGDSLPQASAGSTSTGFNPASATESTESGLIGYLGYSRTQSSTAPTATGKGSAFNPAAASESTASELFAYQGYASTQSTTPHYGTLAPTVTARAARYGVGQYESVSALLNANFATGTGFATGKSGTSVHGSSIGSTFRVSA